MNIFKVVKRAFLAILALLLVISGIAWVYLLTLRPQLEGTMKLKGLSAEVEVYSDPYGVPHIYAQTPADAFYTLGYLHARDRLFQIEMIRRVGKGTLSEIIGPDMLEIDRFFRTIGTGRFARRMADQFAQTAPQEPHRQFTEAYLAGLNQYLATGEVPLEYTVMGIPKEPFTPEDIYAAVGYMAFSFADGLKTDPLMTRMLQKLDSQSLHDLMLHWPEGATTIPVHPRPQADQLSAIARQVDGWMDKLPVPPFIGSNSWVVGPTKTASGKVMFANDTHIAFSQPSVWYEAHLEAPGLELYGNFLACFPFPLVGHTRQTAWGLTMFENDDTDFYIEERAKDGRLKYKGEWAEPVRTQEIIRSRIGSSASGQWKTDTLQVELSAHGPVINQVFAELKTLKNPISLHWELNDSQNDPLLTMFRLVSARNAREAGAAAALLEAPGLNIMFGTAAGEIAWWAAGRLWKRPLPQASIFFGEGGTGFSDIQGYMPFEENPKAVNPASGFVYSANNQPESFSGSLYPGYYVPEDRAKRIMEVLESDHQWDIEKMKSLILDDYTHSYQEIAREIARLMRQNDRPDLEHVAKAIDALDNWDGRHAPEDPAPAILYQTLYFLMRQTLADELGAEDFHVFIKTHLFKRSVKYLVMNDSSALWDDQRTPERETRAAQVYIAFHKAIETLADRYSNDIEDWAWENVHTVEHVHTIGRQKPFDKFFNVGPFFTPGGQEVVNNTGFHLDSTGHFKVLFGPAMRIIIDFADVENAVSVLPTGQSGNRMSPHYADQAELYNSGQFRKMMMNREEIVQSSKKMILKP